MTVNADFGSINTSYVVMVIQNLNIQLVKVQHCQMATLT